MPPRAPGCPVVIVLPGLIARMLVPNWVNSLSTYCRVPSPMEVSRITEAMPIRMPSMVSAERSRWAATAFQASANSSR